MKYLKHINEDLSNLDLKNIIEDEFQDIIDLNKTSFHEINNHINIQIEFQRTRNFNHDISFFNLEEKVIEEKRIFLNQMKKCINNVDKKLFSFESLNRTFDTNMERYEVIFKIKK